MLLQYQLLVCYGLDITEKSNCRRKTGRNFELTKHKQNLMFTQLLTLEANSIFTHGFNFFLPQSYLDTSYIPNPSFLNNTYRNQYETIFNSLRILKSN